MGSQLGLSLSSEDSFLVAGNSPGFLLGHEVSKVPDVFPNEPALRSGLVESLEVLPHELDLEAGWRIAEIRDWHKDSMLDGHGQKESIMVSLYC